MKHSESANPSTNQIYRANKHPPSYCRVKYYFLMYRWFIVCLSLQGEWKDQTADLSTNTKSCGKRGRDRAEKGRNRWDKTQRSLVVFIVEQLFKLSTYHNNDTLLLNRGRESGTGVRDQVWTKGDGKGNWKEDLWNWRLVITIGKFKPRPALHNDGFEMSLRHALASRSVHCLCPNSKALRLYSQNHSSLNFFLLSHVRGAEVV